MIDLDPSNTVTNNRHSVIVAGAASGIGRATALLLAERGWRVVCLDVNEAGADKLAKTIAEQTGEGYGLPMDIADPQSVSEAVSAAEELAGPTHAVVNCVGITGTTNVLSHEVQLADFDRVVAINLRGAFLLSRAVLPGMLKRRYGRILQVASIAGKEGNARMVAYSASKAGLIGMIKAQGKEYAGTGVTVNAVAPAVIQTPLVDAMPPEQVRYMTEKIPMGRLGTLDEIAQLIAFAISPATAFITGFTWDLSGGRATY